MDELLDLVNENDEVVGEVLKSKANSDPKLIHREVVVYIFDEKLRFLVQQRSWNKKVYPGIWAESAAGHVGKGEDIEVAAHRELQEEMGFDVPLKFIQKRLNKFENETHFSYCYLGKYTGEKISFQKEEIEQVKFVTEEEFSALYPERDKVIDEAISWIKEIWKRVGSS
jgi:isopentenyl-diphosphate delta-isomerase type 1